MKPTRAPLIVAIVLLLLPVLYVGSYLALVRPGGIEFRDSDGMKCVFVSSHYSVTASLEHSAGRVFWPLEQIDRKVRPDEWRERSWLQKLPSPHYLRDDIVSFAEGPEVAETERILPGEPTIIHVLNWHYVTREAFAATTGPAGVELDQEYATVPAAATGCVSIAQERRKGLSGVAVIGAMDAVAARRRVLPAFRRRLCYHRFVGHFWEVKGRSSMCGRITLRSDMRQIADIFQAPLPGFDTTPRYNVSPGQFVPAVRGANQREIVQLRLGLIPSWLKDAKIAFSCLNARAYTV